MKPGAGEDPFADTDPETHAERETKADPTGARAVPDTESGFAELVAEELEAIDGGASKTVSVRDANWMAFFRALEDDEAARAQLASALSDALAEDVEPADVDRSKVMRLALTVLLREFAPELEEARRNGVAKHAVRNA